MVTSPLLSKGNGDVHLPILSEGRWGWALETSPAFPKKKSQGMVTSPFHLKGMGIDTSPFYLKGDGTCTSPVSLKSKDDGMATTPMDTFYSL